MDRNVAADLEHAPDERPPAPSQPPRPCPLERRSLPTPAPLPTQTRFRIILGLENACYPNCSSRAGGVKRCHFEDYLA